MSLSQYDRELLKRCLERKNGAWEDFADRFTGLVVTVIRHTAEARAIPVVPEDIDDLVAEVFMQIVSDDFSILRKFRGESSLATYLAVVGRRIVVRKLLKQRHYQMQANVDVDLVADSANERSESQGLKISRDELARILDTLKDEERQVVQMFHLDGMTYQQIEQATGMTANSIGPLLSRARQKLKNARAAT